MAEPAATLLVDLKAQVAAFTAAMKGAAGSALGAEREIKKAMSGVQSIVNAALLITGVVAIKKFSTAMADLARQGEAADDIAKGFQRLGGNVNQIEAAEKAVLGMVDSYELMRIANQGLLKDIPAFNANFGKIAELGARLADTLGTDTASAIEQVVAALATGKTKGLEAVGVFVDQEKAAAAYAKQIGVLSNELSKAQQKEAMQIAAMQQLDTAIQRLAPVTDSATTAMEALGASWAKGQKEMGIAINESEELTNALRKMGDAVNDIDWQRAGRDIAELLAIIANGASEVLPWFVRSIEEVNRGIKVLRILAADGIDFDIGKAQGIVAAQERMRDISEATVKARDAIKGLGEITVYAGDKFVLTNEQLAKGREHIKQLSDAVATGNVKIENAGAVLNNANKMLAIWEQELTTAGGAALKHGEKSEKALRNQQKEAEKAAKEIQKFREEWEKTLQTFQNEQLGKAIDDAIEKLDQASFENLKEDLRRNTEQGFMEGWEDAISKGAVTFEEVAAQAAKAGQVAVEEVQEEWAKAADENAKRIQEEHEEAYRDSIDMWRGLFENAITGATFDLESALKQVAVGFAAELANAMVGGLGGIKSPADLGGLIFKETLGSMFSGGGGLGSVMGGQGGGGLLSSLGINMGAGGLLGSFGGGAGILLDTGSIIGAGAAVPAGATAVGSAALPGSGLLGALGPWGVGAAVGGSLIAANWDKIEGIFGGGTQDPGALARREFGGWMEEQFKKLKQISLFDAGGKLQTMSTDNYDFIVGDENRFNEPGWADEMKTWGPDAERTFMGLGNALKGVLGITEDVGDQMGFLLGENLSKNVDNARLMVQQLGLSFEEMESALVNSGKSGELSWHEVEVSLQGVAQAFEPGLAAVGDLDGALQELLDSGGRGMAALKGVRDIAHEAMEAGLQTIEQMRDRLLAGGANPEVVDSIMQALEQRGISTLEQMASASDRVTGGIVADIQSASASVADMWAKMAQQVDLVTQKIEAIPTEKTITLNWQSHVDATTQEMMNGGGLPEGTTDAPTSEDDIAAAGARFSAARRADAMRADIDLPAMSERQPMPRSFERAESTAPMAINIDARGADAGVEQRLRRTMAKMTQRSMRQVADAIASTRGRGGRYEESY